MARESVWLGAALAVAIYHTNDVVGRYKSIFNLSPCTSY
jgi:hypothetical protein